MRSIILNIGSSCFVRCEGCYNHFASSVKNNNLVQKDNISTFLKELKSIGLKKITIGGGDPLSRLDIIDILKEAKKLDFTVNMDTVGTAFLFIAETIFFGNILIPKVDIESIGNLINQIGIPLDGSNEQIATCFRKGRTNLFEEQISIITSLKKYNFNVCVNTVATKKNIDDISNIYKLLKNLCVDNWQIFQYMPIGPLGFKNQEKFIVSDSEFEDCRKSINKFRDTNFKIEFKSVLERNSEYLIVDDAGMAWIPTNNDNRITIDSINNKTGINNIIFFLTHET